jgi:sirohydrochlorin cobaltochelatase
LKNSSVIVLSCFGSKTEYQKYLDLKDFLKEKFYPKDVFLVFTSKIISNYLKDRGIVFDSIEKIKANYEKVIQIDIKLEAILQDEEKCVSILKEIETKVSKDGVANLYIFHGNKSDENILNYAKNYIDNLKSSYITFIEGNNSFYVEKEGLFKTLINHDEKKIQIIPMLLVSGNHYKNDILKINDELNKHFDSFIVESLTKDERFSLLEIPKIREIIYDLIKMRS